MLLILSSQLLACGNRVVGWLSIDDTAPTVSSTTPADSATEVALNQSITATFSEAMDPLTISTDTFVLFDGATPVSGVVTYVGVIATFNPTNNFDAGTTYTATVRDNATDLAGNNLAEDHEWNFTTGTVTDTLPPQVSATNPENGATEVALNASVTATFSEAMDPLTISTDTFVLFDGTTTVLGAVTYVGVTAIFNPTNNLDAGTTYTATVRDDATGLSGNPLAAEYSWIFTTGPEADTQEPRVTFTFPVNTATGAAVSGNIAVGFSEAMDPSTISTDTFTLLNGATPVSGIVHYVGFTAIFNPRDRLDANSTYTATVRDDAMDLAGNSLAEDYEWSFTTGMVPDTLPPRVSGTNPRSNATGVVLNTSVNATFSEAMDPLTISPDTFVLFDGGTQVPGVVTYVGVTATFNPTDNFNPDTTYRATVREESTDLSGNPLTSDYGWSFTTGLGPDARPPRVTFTVPADGATGVAVGGNIAAIYSEAMDPSTITTANFTVDHSDTPVVGTVTYSGLIATFNPTRALAANTAYTATITMAAQDLAGNSLARNFVWNFRTGATPDTTRPRVISTIPVDNAAEVALHTNVSATFNEVIDPLTITTATFTLQDGMVLIEGAVIQIGATVIFNPTSDLDPDTEYTATITNEATDLAGNALAEDYVWSFTTGSELDLDAPTVILTNPADEATDVPLDATVNATFSEAMDPLTITAANFEVTGPPGAAEVTGTVLYDGLHLIGTFTPDSDLLPGNTYTATITTGAMDLAGNALEEDYVWSFSTGETPLGLISVDLGTLSTFVAVAGAGLTNSNSSGITTLNGDVGLSPTGVCLGDGSPCTATNPVINGTLYANDPEGVAAQAKVDLTAAYLDAMSRPVGTTVNDISGMTLPPGVYTSDSTMSIAVGGTLILDGQGDANAVWIFQIGSSLTVNNDAQVLLINGARARNVFWAIFASSTLGSNVSFQGSILAGASNSVGTDSVVVGRLLCTTGVITLLSNTITVPPL
jgi:hypothetical protein